MNNTLNENKLAKSFYKREVLAVARDLLGKILVKENNNELLSGRIVEVEAYDGRIDEAAHSYSGITKRNKIMFGEGGKLYVYLSYGIHYCCNVVTGNEGIGSAVLIRAVEPLDGIDIMIKNRFPGKSLRKNDKFNLTNGPGKVCKALNITLEHYGENLMGNKLYIINLPLKDNEKIGKSTRIGISKSTELEWRFFIKDNPFLSR